MDLGLSGKRAIVTGGSKGIGRRVVDLLVAEGCNVAFVPVIMQMSAMLFPFCQVERQKYLAVWRTSGMMLSSGPGCRRRSVNLAVSIS